MSTKFAVKFAVNIWRGDNAQGQFVSFTVPKMKSQTVLDSVAWVQQNIEPSLSYRFSCRVGMCGSCAMMVNGKPRWSCRTHIDDVIKANKIDIAPLRNLPVIKDLVVDLDPFFEKWQRAEAVFHPSKTRHHPIESVDPASPGRLLANEAIECINCAVCYAACDTVTSHPEYLGPAALQRAWTRYHDVKDNEQKKILTAVTQEDGCYSCHSQGGCTQYCPNDLNPMAAIAGFKRQGAKAFFKREGL